MENVHTYIPEEHGAKLREHARVSDRSFAAELRRAIRLYVHLIDKQAGIEPAEPIGVHDEIRPPAS